MFILLSNKYSQCLLRIVTLEMDPNWTYDANKQKWGGHDNITKMINLTQGFMGKWIQRTAHWKFWQWNRKSYQHVYVSFIMSIQKSQDSKTSIPSSGAEGKGMALSCNSIWPRGNHLTNLWNKSKVHSTYVFICQNIFGIYHHRQMLNKL